MTFCVNAIGWWGMTETITHGIVGSPHLPNLPMSISRPAPEYGIAVVDDDTVPLRRTRLVETAGSGQLLIRGVRVLSMFQEYLGNASATADSFDEDGWFRTGDRIDVLPDGSLRFGDRTKDMLKVGGENVAACEIERVVPQEPGVFECAVVAKKHAMLEEVPVLFVRPVAGARRGGLAWLAGTAASCLPGTAGQFQVAGRDSFRGRLPAFDAGENSQGAVARHVAGGLNGSAPSGWIDRRCQAFPTRLDLQRQIQRVAA